MSSYIAILHSSYRIPANEIIQGLHLGRYPSNTPRTVCSNLHNMPVALWS